MLCVDPMLRPSAEELLKHKWLQPEVRGTGKGSAVAIVKESAVSMAKESAVAVGKRAPRHRANHDHSSSLITIRTSRHMQFEASTLDKAPALAASSYMDNMRKTAKRSRDARATSITSSDILPSLSSLPGLPSGGMLPPLPAGSDAAPTKPSTTRHVHKVARQGPVLDDVAGAMSMPLHDEELEFSTMVKVRAPCVAVA